MRAYFNRSLALTFDPFLFLSLSLHAHFITNPSQTQIFRYSEMANIIPKNYNRPCCCIHKKQPFLHVFTIVCFMMDHNFVDVV